MKFNILQPCAKDQVPILSYIATAYLLAIGILSLIR